MLEIILNLAEKLNIVVPVSNFVREEKINTSRVDRYCNLVGPIYCNRHIAKIHREGFVALCVSH